MLIQTNSNVLFIIPAFIQYVPNHVHTTCLWDDFFLMGGEQEGRWRLQLREMAAKPETTASDGSLTYVGVQELDF